MIGIRRWFAVVVWLVAAGLVAGCSPDQPPSRYRLDAQSSLAWTFDAGGAIHQPPLVQGDLVIVAPAGGPLTAVDTRSGRLRWQYDPPQGLWERSVAGDGQRVFAALKGGEVVALDAARGQVLWRRELGIEAQTPLLVHGDTLYVPTTFVGPELVPEVRGRAQLFALEAASGEQVWAFETGNYILQTPARHGDMLYVGGNFYDPRPVDEGGHARIYALDAADAAVRWAYEAEDGFPKRLHATGKTLVFVGYQDFLNGVDASQGTLRWRRDTGNWTPGFLGVEDAIFSSAANTSVARIDADSGALVWQFNIPGGSFNYLLGEPVLEDGLLVFLTQQGDIHALDAATGNPLWRLDTGVVAARTGLSLGDGWLYFGDAQGKVYAYTSADR